jgi:aspartokinase-like uncharacterized kinase
MKQKDIALIVVVVIVSGMLSLFLTRFLFASPDKRQVQAEVVDPIVPEFNATLDKKYFNKNAINPTQVIQIGDGSNNSPFNSGQ